MCIRDRICITAKEVIGKVTMVIEERLLLVPELMEAPGEEVAEDDFMQEAVDKNQTDMDQLIVYRSKVHDTTGMIPAKLVVERRFVILRT